MGDIVGVRSYEEGGKTVYQFDVRMHSILRGVDVTDRQLEREVAGAFDTYSHALKRRYGWIEEVRLEGRSGGRLAVVARRGDKRATKEVLRKIGEEVYRKLRDFAARLRRRYGESEWYLHETGRNPRTVKRPPKKPSRERRGMKPVPDPRKGSGAYVGDDVKRKLDELLGRSKKGKG